VIGDNRMREKTKDNKKVEEEGQRVYESSESIDCILKKGVVLGKGNYVESSLPAQMPRVEKNHTLVGVVNSHERIAGEIRNIDDYERFLRGFRLGSFIDDGEYLICSLPNDVIKSLG